MSEPFPNNTPPVINAPGHLLLSSFEIEIQRFFREDEDTILLAFDEFALPAIDTRSFQLVWGPGMPVQEFPGPVSPMSIEIGLTTFYQRHVWEFFVKWREDALRDIIHNRHNGNIIGYDEDRNIQYKANLTGVWCKRVDLARAQRNLQKHSIAVTLSIYDYVHDFDFAKFNQKENIIL